MRVINIIRDFGATHFSLNFPKKDASVKKCINDYNENININQLIRDMIFELAVTGNLVCYDRDGDCVDIYPINQIEVIPLTKGSKQMVGFKVDSLYSSIGYLYDEEINKMIETAYPPEVLAARKKGSMIAVLEPDNAYFAKINSSRYERYGIPVILPAFDDLAHKSLLKEAERSTANGIIDKIMQIKIGDADNKPSESLIKKYDNIFNGVSGSIRAVLPYYVDISWVEPEANIFGTDKFVEIDKDILNTLGVSLSLIRGEGGGNYAEGMISFTGLTRAIDNIRSQVPNIIHGLYRAELERSGLDPEKAPTITFDDVVIDKDAKLNLVKELFQSAGLPYSVLYEEFGYDFDYIKMVREQENTENLEETFKLHSMPFQGGFSGDDNGDPNSNNPDNNDPDNKGGRPKESVTSRKSDKNQSNNSTPRAGIKNRS